MVASQGAFDSTGVHMALWQGAPCIPLHLVCMNLTLLCGGFKRNVMAAGSMLQHLVVNLERM